MRWLLLTLLAACATTEPVEEAEKETKNQVRVFGGATTRDGHTGGSVGLIYERELTPVWAVGFVAEVTPSLRDRLVTVPSLFIHPWKDLALTVAPGVQVEEDEASFVMRFGAGWDFELGKGWSIAPEINLDLVGDGGPPAFVYGLSLGFDF